MGGFKWEVCADAQNDPCGCTRVTCAANHITEINLQSDMVGVLPDSLGQLTALEVLSVTLSAGLTGTIPRSIGQLGALAHLQFNSNALTGEIPGDALGKLPHLTRMWLNDNQFAGLCPPMARYPTQCDMSNIPFACPASTTPGAIVCPGCTTPTRHQPTCKKSREQEKLTD